MEPYLDQLSKIYNIESTLEKKILKKMEDGMYDDSFISKFKQSFITLKIDHLEKLDYKLKEHETIRPKIDENNKLINKIKKVQTLRKSINDLQFDNFKQEFYTTEILKETFNIVLKKYNSIQIQDKYAMMADRLTYEYVADESVIINKLPKKELVDTLIYDFSSAPIAEKFSYQNINYLLNVIQKVKKDKNVVLYIYFAPHIELMNKFYLLLSHIFSSIDIYFPMNMSITNNKCILVCHQKINSLKGMNEDKIYGIEINSELSNEVTNKMMEYELEIFRFIKYYFELFLYLLMIKKKDSLKYNIIKYKILYKIYPKMLYLK